MKILTISSGGDPLFVRDDHGHDFEVEVEWATDARHRRRAEDTESHSPQAARLVSAAGWEAAKRLGVQTIECENCTAPMLVVLPQRHDRPTQEGRAPIRSAYWRVEERERRWISGAPSRSWVCCSQDCARTHAAELEREHRHTLPRMRFSIHGPVTYVES